jgi:hypothetical protein
LSSLLLLDFGLDVFDQPPDNPLLQRPLACLRSTVSKPIEDVGELPGK